LVLRADLTAVVTPGYQFPLDGSVAPTFQLLNELAQPTVTVYGTTGGTNLLTPGSVTGVSLSDTLPDGTTITWNAGSPRQLAVLPGGIAGWGLIGEETNLQLYIDTNYFGLATNSFPNTNTTTTAILGATTFPAYFLTLVPGSLSDANVNNNAAIQPFKLSLYSNTITAGGSTDAGSNVWLGPQFVIVPAQTNQHAGTNILGPQLQLTTFTSGLLGMPSGGGLIRTKHGFTNTPSFVRWVVVETNASGDSGYPQNFEMDVASVNQNQEAAFASGADATNVWLAYGNNGAFLFVGTNGNQGGTRGNWNAKCYARP
jgi:hypothetical protein